MKQTNSIFTQLYQTLNQIIVGQNIPIQQLLIALLTGGHVIIEGVPGTGKTLTVKALARLIQAEFSRVQLTPDILPSDILGTNVFDLNSRNFTLKKGPIFTEILLADEINRTPPKTQAALLEAMAEQQVTLDGETLPLPNLFWVIATQNSLEFEGTYPLPEAQLDRFLFKIIIDYPDIAAEKQMLLNVQQGFAAKSIQLNQIQPIATVEQIIITRQEIEAINVQEKILDYLLGLVKQTRKHPDVALGASPRATVAWLQTSKTQAWLNNRNYVTPDDIKTVALPLLRHRLILKPEAQLDGIIIDSIINSILKQVSVPR
ncbi:MULTISPECIES: MoxR family ATPase [Okeania]|uniref:AAA family ATPase n=1 Tax=Okeania TaxID=1458928 RepID=UPI000F54358A|nr:MULTISPECIES: MoxR family ATPase [Okeania]NES74303.1 MoxR family ATPase [Okeania sp. SIO1H4]NET18323.1 MoxR family ATPase [Okeania sp. SIO1H5]NET96745.1 MoxR family ATPase [Okeania sp. SIO1H2]RQH23968.1 MoxR family ATPase [Okeania hirsuta]